MGSPKIFYHRYYFLAFLRPTEFKNPKNSFQLNETLNCYFFDYRKKTLSGREKHVQFKIELGLKFDEYPLIDLFLNISE